MSAPAAQASTPESIASAIAEIVRRADNYSISHISTALIAEIIRAQTVVITLTDAAPASTPS